MEIRKQKGKQVGRLTVTDKQHQEDLQRLRLLRPIDDDFMRCLFKDNIPLAEFVLRIITDKPDLIITDCETQKDMKRLAGHVLSAWTHMERIQLGKNTIWKFRGKTKEQTHIGQGIIQV